MARKYKIGSGFHIITPIAAVILLLIVFVSVGYFVIETIPAVPPDNSEVLRRLETSRSLWARKRPVAFRYVVERDCSCADEIRRPYIVTEQSGQRRAEYPIPVESAGGAQLREPTEPAWLDDVFERIAEADAQSLAVTARFDSSFGFPSRVIIRRGAEADEIVEEYEIRDFEVLYRR